VNLFRDGQWLIAVIVFLASIMIPLFKLLGLLYVTASTRVTTMRSRRNAPGCIGSSSGLAVGDARRLHHAILVALVKLGQVVTVLPGRGLLPFAAVVVLTILASASFDPRLLWEQPKPCHEQGKWYYRATNPFGSSDG